jgi:hypothetical protein
MTDAGRNELGVSVVGDATAGQFALFKDALSAAPVTGCDPDSRCSLTNVESISVSLGDGSDTVDVGPMPVPTTVDGGAGVDRADHSASAAPAIIKLDGTTTLGNVSLNGIEDATGGAEGDNITGSVEPNNLAGLAGPDTIHGGDGSDHISGGTGDDHLFGDAGDDTLRADAGVDTLDGGDGNDTLIAGDGASSIDAGAGDDDVLAVDGVQDTITCGDGSDSVAADLGAGGVMDNVDPSCETVTGPTALAVDPATTTTGSGSTVIDTTIEIPSPRSTSLPAAGGAVETPRDLTPPSAALRVGLHQRLGTAIARGMAVPVSCAEPCRMSVSLQLDRKDARRLGIAGRTGPTLVGFTSLRLPSAGSRRLHVRLMPSSRKVLRSSKRGVGITVQMLASDGAGNGTLLQRRVIMHR